MTRSDKKVGKKTKTQCSKGRRRNDLWLQIEMEEYNHPEETVEGVPP